MQRRIIRLNNNLSILHCRLVAHYKHHLAPAKTRNLADSDIVHIVFDITDMAKAKAAIASEEKKKLMMSAGVVGAPKIAYFTGAN